MIINGWYIYVGEAVYHYLDVFVNWSGVLLTMKWEHNMGELLG